MSNIMVSKFESKIWFLNALTVVPCLIIIEAVEFSFKVVLCGKISKHLGTKFEIQIWKP